MIADIRLRPVGLEAIAPPLPLAGLCTRAPASFWPRVAADIPPGPRCDCKALVPRPTGGDSILHRGRGCATVEWVVAKGASPVIAS